MAIEWDSDFSQITIHFKRKEANTIKTWDFLCEIIFLFKKLECDNLIGIYNNTKVGKETAIYDRTKYEKSDSGYYGTIEAELLGKVARGYNWGTIAEFYSDISKDLARYSNSSVYVSQTLKDLVKDNFESAEQKRHEESMAKEQKRHKYTMILAWVAIGVSIGISFVDFLQEPSDKIITPLNSINKNMSGISLKVDSINSNTIKLNKDSLNTIP